MRLFFGFVSLYNVGTFAMNFIDNWIFIVAVLPRRCAQRKERINSIARCIIEKKSYLTTDDASMIISNLTRHLNIV